MHDSNDLQPEFELSEENHDGRTMIVLALGAATALGILVAGGFAAVSFLMSTDKPEHIASHDTVDTANKNQVVTTDLIAETPVTAPAVPAPVDLPEADSANNVVDNTDSSEQNDSRTERLSTEAESQSVPAQSESAVVVEPSDRVAPTTDDSEPSTPPITAVATGTSQKPQPIASAPDQLAAATPEASSTTTEISTQSNGDALPPTASGKAASQQLAAVAASASGTPLLYRWNPGEIQGYTVDMTATVNNQKQSVTGTVELTNSAQPPEVDSSKKVKKEKPATGTGTGFVVGADGYLMTCAHVVQGADTIEVSLQDKTYTASVVAVEPDDDLALLKIEATGLQPLLLADSGKVRLGEEVRAIGFPLSTVLGNGIKVTRGIVAGIVERDQGKRFQIDAAVNPGNSGGPVVNNQGQVLGVASSKLIGLELTRVGFCVPAERTLALLKANKVPPVSGNPDKELDGPDLVAAVSPSVALITVTIDPQKVSGNLVRITTSGSFRTKSQSRSRTRPSFSFPNMTFNSGSLNVDAYGNVASFDSPNQLPFLAGPMSLLTIHQFDQAGRSSWTVRDRIKVTVQQSNSPLGRIRPRIPVPRGPRSGPRGRDPFAPKTVKEFEALEVHQYRIVSDSDDQVVLEKTFTLTTLDDDESPYFRITGKGEVIFSRRIGLVESFDFDHHFEKNDGEKQVQIAVKIAVKRQDPAVVAAKKRESAIAQARAEHASAVKAANKPVVPAGEQLDTLLAKLKEETRKTGGYPSTQLSALSKLEVIPERRNEVESLLIDLLESKQYLTVRAALGALEKWGTTDSVPAITAQLKHSQLPVVQSAIKALSTFKEKQSIAPLLEVLRKNQLARHDAKGALVKFGKAAEEPVVAMLFEDNRQLFQAACDILKDIGGEDSVDALESIVEGKDVFRKSYAGRSLTSVKSRVAAAANADGSKPAVEPSVAKVETVLKAMDAKPEKNGFTRTRALMRLGPPTDYKQDELEVALLKALDDPNFAVQHQAMMALQKRATTRSVPRLLIIVADTKSKLQHLAAQTLRKTGVDTDAEQKLAGELAKGNLKLQKAVIDLLTEIGSPESLTALDKLANADQATSIQYGAARAAARIRLRAGMPISS